MRGTCGACDGKGRVARLNEEAGTSELVPCVPCGGTGHSPPGGAPKALSEASVFRLEPESLRNFFKRNP